MFNLEKIINESGFDYVNRNFNNSIPFNENVENNLRLFPFGGETEIEKVYQKLNANNLKIANLISLINWKKENGSTIREKIVIHCKEYKLHRNGIPFIKYNPVCDQNGFWDLSFGFSETGFVGDEYILVYT